MFGKQPVPPPPVPVPTNEFVYDPAIHDEAEKNLVESAMFAMDELLGLQSYLDGLLANAMEADPDAEVYRIDTPEFAIKIISLLISNTSDVAAAAIASDLVSARQEEVDAPMQVIEPDADFPEEEETQAQIDELKRFLGSD